MKDVILQGDCIKMLANVPEKSVQTCVTSPPYFGLRDYGVEGQIGLEETPEAYVQRLVEVFRAVKRVLRDDGTLWLNLGDSYASTKAGNTNGTYGKVKQKAGVNDDTRVRTIPPGLKQKDLIGIPWRVAFALQQPYVVPVCVKDETDRAWLAAMFDGEGCIGIRRYDSYREGKQYQDGFVAYTVVTNNDVELLERCVAITGKGKVALKQKANSTDGRGIVSRRDSYGWRLDGNDAIDVIRAIYPYLIAKRKQAQLAFTLDTINKDKHRVEGKVPKEDQEKKMFCYESIKACNQRQSVDIPKWIQEPKQKVEDGWYLRQDIIWHKPNPMPESVTDRCTKAHEYIFLLSKSPRYYFDHEAIKEPAIYGAKGSEFHTGKTGESQYGKAQPRDRRAGKGRIAYKGKRTDDTSGKNGQESFVSISETRNKRSVWTVTTKPYKGAHFATFPPDLITPCILAGSAVGDLVLDPFMGSGTTAAVAKKLGRRYAGTELNPEYIKLANKRLEETLPAQNTLLSGV